MSHVRHTLPAGDSGHQNAAAMADPLPDDPLYPGWVRRNLRPEDLDGDDPNDVRALCRFGVLEDRPAKAVMFREGEPPVALYLIAEGDVELFYERRGEHRIIQVCRSGSIIGDLPVMLGLPAYAYSAATRTDARLLRFSMETIRALVDVNPAICLRFLRLVSRRLERAEQRLLELSGRSALERTVGFLLRETDEGDSARVSVTQGDAAAALGLSRQTVSRVLRELEDLGLIARGRGHVQIVDYGRLNAISDPLGTHDPS